MERDLRCYLAVVRAENLEWLVQEGLSFFAVSSKNSRIGVGDRIVLYKSGSKVSGIVGTFEVTGPPQEVRAGSRAWRFPVRIPWRVILNAIDRPLPIPPLVASLQLFARTGRNYGSALQGTIKFLSVEDYNFIDDALRKHMAQ